MASAHGPTMVFEPDEWTVELAAGGHIQLRANGFAVENGVYRFNVLMVGDPDFWMTVACIPAELVDDVFGGPN